MRQKTRASPNQDDSVAGSEQDSIGVVGWACWSPQAGEGLRDGFRRLRRLGLRTQALKSALAAGLAWAVGAYVPWGPAQPYLAPLTAILTIQATIAESMQGALQRVLGVAVGVGMAALASHTIGASPLTIALLVVLSQALGSLLG